MGRQQLFFLLSMGVILSGCAAHNHASRKGIISPELPLTVDDLGEIKEGEANHKRVLWQYKIYSRPHLQKYCNEIAAEIAQVSTRPHLPYHVTLLDSEEVNIFGGPGGYIYMTKGLFQYIESEGELAGLLAHEITHVANYEYSNIPHLSKVKRVYGLMLQGSEIVQNTGAAGVYGKAANMGIKGLGKAAPVLGRKFTSDQEVATDEKAIDSLMKAGYDPREYQAFIERLARVNMDDVARFVGLLNTHPPFEERRKILAERIRDLKLERSKVEFKKDLLGEIRREETSVSEAFARQPAEPSKSIVFQPKFKMVTDQPPIESLTPVKQQSKMSPDRKRFSAAWF